MGIQKIMSTHKKHLYCFSPPVMLATMLIEFGLAAYTLLGFKMTRRAFLTID